MLRRLAIIVTAVASLLVCAPAQADWRVDRAERISAVVWKRNVTIRFADPATRGLPPGAAGWADEGSGVVYINPRHSDFGWWEAFCSDVLHEGGHEAGYRDPLNPADPLHSHRPGSVMYAVSLRSFMSYRLPGSRRVVRRVDGADWRCRHGGRPYLRAHRAR